MSGALRPPDGVRSDPTQALPAGAGRELHGSAISRVHRVPGAAKRTGSRKERDEHLTSHERTVGRQFAASGSAEGCDATGEVDCGYSFADVKYVVPRGAMFEKLPRLAGVAMQRRL